MHIVALINQDHVLLSLKYPPPLSASFPLSIPLHPLTFSNVSVCCALELPCAQQEARPVVRVALTAGGGA